MKIAIVKKSDLTVINYYEDSAIDYTRFNGPWGDTATVVHIAFPTEGTQFESLKATDEGGGSYSIAFDQVTLDAYDAMVTAV